MGRRLLWFAVGVGVTALVVVKGKEIYQRFTPQGVADQITRTRTDLTGWLGEFVGTVTESMAEREVELREAIGLDG